MPAYKDEKRNTWYCQFWQTDFTGARKHIVKRGFKTRREAKEYEENYKDSNKKTSSITLGGLYESYNQIYIPNLKLSTQDNKRQLIEAYILPYFKSRKINEIDSRDIAHWQIEVQKSKNLSDTYLKSINTQMSALFNFAKKHYGLSVNPVVIAGSMGKKKPTEEMQFWTLDEFNQFIQYVNELTNQIAFKILYWCGLRKGELMALTPDEILASKEIEIKKTAAWRSIKGLSKEELDASTWKKIDGKKGLEITIPKTEKSIRKVAIPDFLYKEIKEWMKMLYGLEHDSLLFEYNSNHTLNSILDRSAKKAGVKRIRVHDLRHSHASLCIEAGIGVLLLSERLGHENIETTLNTYSHLYPNKQAALADDLNKLATGEKTL